MSGPDKYYDLVRVELHSKGTDLPMCSRNHEFLSSAASDRHARELA